MNSRDTRSKTTLTLVSAVSGDPTAVHDLVDVLYGELRGMASGFLSAERNDHTLQPTALVHEAYMRLIDQTRTDWQDRQHFMAIAAKQMRRILIDHARARGAAKRGGQWRRITLTGLDRDDRSREVDPVELDDALSTLAELHPRQAEIAELRYLSGLTVDEVASALGVSVRTVAEDWRMARAWLHQRLVGRSS